MCSILQIIKLHAIMYNVYTHSKFIGLKVKFDWTANLCMLYCVVETIYLVNFRVGPVRDRVYWKQYDRAVIEPIKMEI